MLILYFITINIFYFINIFFISSFPALSVFLEDTTDTDIYIYIKRKRKGCHGIYFTKIIIISVGFELVGVLKDFHMCKLGQGIIQTLLKSYDRV